MITADPISWPSRNTDRSWRVRCDAHPDRPLGNMVLVPDKAAEVHRLGDVEHTAHDLPPPVRQGEAVIVARGIPDPGSRGRRRNGCCLHDVRRVCGADALLQGPSKQNPGQAARRDQNRCTYQDTDSYGEPDRSGCLRMRRRTVAPMTSIPRSIIVQVAGSGMAIVAGSPMEALRRAVRAAPPVGLGPTGALAGFPEHRAPQATRGASQGAKPDAWSGGATPDPIRAVTGGAPNSEPVGKSLYPMGNGVNGNALKARSWETAPGAALPAARSSGAEPMAGLSAAAGTSSGASRSRTAESTRSCGAALAIRSGLVESKAPEPRSPGDRLAKSVRGALKASTILAAAILLSAGLPRSTMAPKTRPASTASTRTVRFRFI